MDSNHTTMDPVSLGGQPRLFLDSWDSLKDFTVVDMGMDLDAFTNLATPELTTLDTPSSTEATSPPPSSANPTASSTAASSLDILRPRPWVPSSPDDRSRSPTSELLERLSRQLIECFCSQDWDSPLMALATPNFSGYIDHVETRIRSWEEHVAFYQRLHTTHPGYTFAVESVSADVDDEKGVASVWALLTVTGYPAHIRRESLTVLGWRRRKGKWRCYKQLGIRGVNWFDD